MSITRSHVAAAVAAATALVGASAPAASAAAKPSTAHSGTATPDINRVDCFLTSDASLHVVQSNSHGEDCFENAGFEYVTIYHIDYVYTGNNTVNFILAYNGRYIDCADYTKYTDVFTSQCGVPWNAGTMATISIP